MNNPVFILAGKEELARRLASEMNILRWEYLYKEQQLWGIRSPLVIRTALAHQSGVTGAVLLDRGARVIDIDLDVLVGASR